jgi:hypothetical protein
MTTRHSKRNAAKRALTSRLYRQRVVKSKRVYSRKGGTGNDREEKSRVRRHPAKSLSQSLDSL